MATAGDIPELVGEFVDLAKQYVREQTLEPAKKLGRLAGFSLAAALIFVLAAVFLAIAGMRAIVDLMPDGTIWSGFGYVLSALALLAATGLVMWRAAR
jgi:uncharacterized protein (DUF849 family)